MNHSTKSIDKIYHPPQQHWVGDGFPVRTLFSYASHGQALSPFLLFDFAGPYSFSPAEEPRGVGLHPHRGFETVTFIYQGEVSHQDSAGHSGTIAAGDVQWMTAARGVLHEEFHSKAFTASGGPFLVAQLWVNLPSQEKMAPPRYQTLLSEKIPVVHFKDHKGFVRIIAGDFEGKKGAAKTVTAMNIWDIRLNKGSQHAFLVPEDWNTALVLMEGKIKINDKDVVEQAQLVTFEKKGEELNIEALDEAIVLLLSGEPINETIVGRGPFVMNTKEEINQAYDDYYSGRFTEDR